MRTDAEIRRDIVDELQWDPRLGENVIRADVSRGTATLTGTVETYAQKVAARQAAERVGGVHAIVNEIVVAPPLHLQRMDSEIARCVGLALDLNVLVPPGSVRVSVRQGWVTLEGTVANHYQRDAALGAAEVLGGIRGISCRIAVEPTESIVPSTRVAIEGALQRSAELDCKHIVVQVTDSEVTLRGIVRSWAERQDATRAAWSAPGIRAVIDRLVVCA